MKHVRFLGWLSLLVAAALRLQAAEEKAAGSVEGDWVPVKAELGGQPMPEGLLKTISLKLANGIYEVMVANQPDKGTYELDAKSAPKGMVIRGTEGPNKGKVFPAIYEMGNGTLRICYDLSGAKQPKEFKTVSGTKLYLVTYQRKK
jgi:uncharacterized protein (TIGR03067 family)